MSRRSYERSRAGALGSCSVEGCWNPTRVKGLCSMHYYRKLGTGDVGPAESMRRGPRQCLVVDCENRAVTSTDLCPTHARRKRLYGNPDGTFSTSKTCESDGCEVPAVLGWKTTGFCQDHYIEYVRGEVFAGRDIGTMSPNGYRYISIFRKRQAIHQIVMEVKLGRPLYQFENVHHLNGIRDDNRPENLELWVKPQPAGQRPEDLVEWVMDTYPELISERQR